MKVTVAIPTYNRPEFLAEAVASVLAQSYKDIRILVLDDGPSKETEKVVASFHAPNVEYHANVKNLGGWRNMNQAFDLCESEYLNIFHDDDRQLPWMIEKEVGVLDAMPDVSMVFTSKHHYIGDATPAAPPKKLKGTYYAKYKFVAAQSNARANIVPPSPMFRMSDVRKYNLRFNPNIGGPGDFYMWYCVNRVANVYALRYPLLEYRLDNPKLPSHAFASSSHSHQENDWLQSLIKLDALLTELHSEYRGVNLENMRARFAETILSPMMRDFVEQRTSIEAVLEQKAALEKIGWFIKSDRRFNFLLAKSVLGDTVRSVGRGKMSIGDFTSRMREVEKRGVKIPFERKIGWYLRYVLIKRWLKL
jgi:glycosyltransferase involved in cell wall biosynthesis